MNGASNAMCECIDLHDAELVIRRMTNLDIGSRCIPETTRPPTASEQPTELLHPMQEAPRAVLLQSWSGPELAGWRLQPPNPDKLRGFCSSRVCPFGQCQGRVIPRRTHSLTQATDLRDLGNNCVAVNAWVKDVGDILNPSMTRKEYLWILVRQGWRAGLGFAQPNPSILWLATAFLLKPFCLSWPKGPAAK